MDRQSWIHGQAELDTWTDRVGYMDRQSWIRGQTELDTWTGRVGYMDRQMDSGPVMYDNVSSSQLELGLLEYFDEVNDGSCVDWAVVLWPVIVLILMQAGRSNEEEDSG